MKRIRFSTCFTEQTDGSLPILISSSRNSKKKPSSKIKSMLPSSQEIRLRDQKTVSFPNFKIEEHIPHGCTSCGCMPSYIFAKFVFECLRHFERMTWPSETCVPPIRGTGEVEKYAVNLYWPESDSVVVSHASQ